MVDLRWALDSTRVAFYPMRNGQVQGMGFHSQVLILYHAKQVTKVYEICRFSFDLFYFACIFSNPNAFFA